MINVDRKNITIIQWLCLIYDELVELNKNIKKLNDGNNKPPKKGKEQQS